MIFKSSLTPLYKFSRTTPTSNIDHNACAVYSKHTEAQKKAAATTEQQEYYSGCDEGQGHFHNKSIRSGQRCSKPSSGK